MTRPNFCTQCHTAVPLDVPMLRRGVFWLCVACAAVPCDPCAEGQHRWAGAVDDAGTSLWCCATCGAVLWHQAIRAEVVEAPKEPETPLC